MSRAKRKAVEWMLRKRFRDDGALTAEEKHAVDALQAKMSRHKTLTDGEAAAFVAGMRL